MKKKLIITITVLALIIVLAVITVIFRANSIVKANQKNIEAALAKATGFDITLGELDFSLIPSARLESSGAIIKKQGTTAKGLTVGKFSAAVELLPLLKKEILISEIEIEQPEITFIKTSSGTSIAGLEKSDSQNKSASTTAKTQDKIAANKSGAPDANVLKIDLKRFTVSNAKIIFDDQVLKKTFTLQDLNLESALQIKQNELNLSDLEINGNLNQVPLRILAPSVDLNLNSFQLNSNEIKLSLARIALVAQAAMNIKSGDGKLNLNQLALNLEDLPDILEKILAIKLPFAPKGAVNSNLEVTLSKFLPSNLSGILKLLDLSSSFGTQNLSKLTGNIDLSGNLEKLLLASKKVTFLVNNVPVEASLNNEFNVKEILNSDLSLNLLHGAVRSATQLALKDKTFTGQVKINNIGIEEALKNFAPQIPLSITGKLNADINNISAQLSPKLLPSFKANATLDIKDGQIKNLNLAREVFNSVKNLPFISGSLLDVLPPETDALMQAKDTTIKALNYRGAVANQRLLIDQFNLVSDLFELTSTGSIGFQKDLDLKAQFKLIPSISQKVILKVKELKSLVDSSGALVIPVAISGTMPKVIVTPDVSKIASSALENKVKEKASEFLERSLNKDKDSKTRKVLDSILGF